MIMSLDLGTFVVLGCLLATRLAACWGKNRVLQHRLAQASPQRPSAALNAVLQGGGVATESYLNRRVFRGNTQEKHA